ncbi:hypothetical protein [Antiquaquibacter soli]|uniref:Uncharacterized protein n=1 Tax=Antiquaquibacter soli TaxID=3064523 RepID=A0ABT9BJS8_9MICO|nr:hypothetical protein [Protaetiibacter sp. WY-16]MDO7880809.1 hypothetical protein [Protaetiibacter sp. WY-16]
MKRTIIHLDGEEYIVGLSIDDVRAAMDAILETGAPGWLRVNHGRAELRVADILVSSGMTVGLVDASDPENLERDEPES